MKELSLHLLDIVQNSITAGATRIDITITDSVKQDLVIIEVKDNGCGMTPEFVKKVTDPFTTTRTTRKVGLGVPLFKLAAETAGGEFNISSEVGKGTLVHASFQRSNIDRPPLGDLRGTLITLIQGSPDIDIIYTYLTDSGQFVLDTHEIRTIMEGVAINEPEVLNWIGNFISENEAELSAATFNR